ncbi:MAG: histidine kinase [Bellilinea sp.]
MRKSLLVFLHVFSLFTLVLIGWAVALAVQKPSIGAYWGYPSGIVYAIDAGHPSSQVFRVGDRILRIEEISRADWYKLPGTTPGQNLSIEVERDGQTHELDVQIAQSNIKAILGRIPPFLVALGFWIAGSYVLAFSRARQQAILFFLLCQIAVVTLTSGAISAYGPEWTKIGLHCGLLWLGVAAVQLHLVFPKRIDLLKKRQIGSALVLVTALISSIYLIEKISGIALVPVSFMWAATITVFAIDIVVVIWMLAQSYRKSSNVIERNQVGIITLSSLIGILPVVTMILIPQLILGHPWVSFDLAFLALLAIPLGYGFAIYRYKLIGVKETINRGLAIVLVLLLLTGFYSLFFSISSRFISASITESPAWGLVTTVILAGSAVKLYGSLTRFVNQILYGGWYDFRTVVEQTRHSLTTTEHNQESIGASLAQVIGQSMRLETVSLILSDRIRSTYEHGLTVRTEILPDDQICNLADIEALFTNEPSDFQPWDSEYATAYPLAILKNGVHPTHLVPMKGKDGHMIGGLFLGEKRDGEPLSEADFEILKVVIHQAQVTLENVKLLEEAQKHLEKISRLHRQVLRGREEERKRLARDLHDLVIQSLAGLNYQMAEIRTQLNGAQTENLVKAQTEVRELIGVLRQICNDLRPPTLDVLDFFEAIQSKITEVEENADFKVRALIEGNENQEMGEDVKLCIYRLVQESLVNVHKHAHADHVEVWVKVTSEQVSVMVTDNGKGFTVPDRLELLVPDRHYGLIGIKEMVEAVNGCLSISSSPGQGCILSAQVPI